MYPGRIFTEMYLRRCVLAQLDEGRDAVPIPVCGPPPQLFQEFERNGDGELQEELAGMSSITPVTVN